ncbi:hypothetical protein D3C71_1790110 [compost metagenome]
MMATPSPTRAELPAGWLAVKLWLTLMPLRCACAWAATPRMRASLEAASSLPTLSSEASRSACWPAVLLSLEISFCASALSCSPMP